MIGLLHRLKSDVSSCFLEEYLQIPVETHSSGDPCRCHHHLVLFRSFEPAQVFTLQFWSAFPPLTLASMLQ